MMLPSRSILIRLDARDFLVEQAIGVDQEVIVFAGHADRDVVRDHVRHVPQRDETVAGGQVDAGLPFLGETESCLDGRSRSYFLPLRPAITDDIATLPVVFHHRYHAGDKFYKGEILTVSGRCGAGFRRFGRGWVPGATAARRRRARWRGRPSIFGASTADGPGALGHLVGGAGVSGGAGCQPVPGATAPHPPTGPARLFNCRTSRATASRGWCASSMRPAAVRWIGRSVPGCRW